MKKMFIKENGEIRVISIDSDNDNEIKKGIVSPCFNCEKAYATKCPKVADGLEKSILKYDFITDGCQVNDEKGHLESMVVLKCNNYEQDRKREKATTKEQIEALKRLKESIKILYFGGIDIDEADRIQDHQVKRHIISDVEQNIYTLK